ncbi:hypothetical protein DA718_09765 [Klebsiella huaxiensis]|uniref:Glycoside hydrolase family 5 domain-containing protein n=1 Tax=Klebsiella huaxiensis TaxID=2153354 RepID=A0ABT6EFW7_9ENTR|nr:cellulase family glycosylhydrolase [Klebsiella huaxiensis]MDG1644317.1 hypothetical protein [Klebsiella huaxiensis]QBG07463.1 hypothetical protein DA718_09765 [Klebsiella huaxiensis]VUS54936.1 hypothetical protein SB6425_00007 [Klebsiella huaxiensis]
MRYFYGVIFIFFGFFSNMTFGFELGVHTHAQKYSEEANELKENIEKFGFNSIRTDMSWSWVEKLRGNYAMGEAAKKSQSLVDSFTSDNNSALIVLAYGNPLYTPTGFPENEQQIQDFVNYTTFVVSNNKGKAKYYEIWNEWTYKTGIPDRRNKVPSSDIYLELVKKTYENIKAIDPDAIILTGTVNPTNKRDVEWFDQLIDKGILNYIDGVSLHPYSFMHGNKKLRGATENYQTLVEYQKHLVTKSKKNIRLYITEMGIPTYDGEGGVSRLDAARFIFKYTLLVMSNPDIKGIWWYDYSDDGLLRRNKENNFGMIDFYFKPKSSILAISAVSKITNKSLITSEIKDDTVIINIKSAINGSTRHVSWSDKSPANSSVNVIDNGSIYEERKSKTSSEEQFLFTPQVY